MSKCIILLILVSAFQTFSKGYGQDKINVDLQNASLRKAFKEIEKNTSYRFLFNDGLLPKDQNNITLNVVNGDINKIMSKLLSDSKLTYKLSSNLVIIARAENIVLAVTISGKITDSKGEALIGATVLEKGTTNGASTDINGNFKLNLNDANATLVVKFLGYTTREIAVSGRSTVDIVLDENSSNLSEVVVIGYGTRTKKDLTGSVSSLSGEDIVNSKAPNAQEALQGRLTGVDVKRSSGKPGADFNIEIRGANSISQTTQPLYVIDGIVTANSLSNPINNINPADIERIDVLKDASSTAIYGSRGANGVIIVTTKRGSKSGGTKINYDGYAGVVQPYNLPKIMDGPTFVNYARDFYNEQAILNGQPTPVADNKIFSATELTNIANGTYANWPEMIRRTAFQSNHNLSVTGGDEKTTYFISGGYQLYQGATKVENTKKYTLKVGLEKNLGNWLKAGASLYSTYADIHPGSIEVFRSSYRLRPTGSAYNADGTKRFFVYEGESQITNPLFEFENEIRAQQYVNLLPNLFAEATLIKGLKLRTSFSPDLTFGRGGQYNDVFSKQQAGTKPAVGQYSTNHLVNYTFDNQLTYTKDIAKHKFDVLAGSSLIYQQQDNASITATGLPYKSLWYNLATATAVTINGVTTQPVTSVNTNYSQSNLESFLARINYSYNNKYMLTLTGRADGYSVFAPGHKWGYFPSAGVAWIASEESFLKNVKAISFLKFRASYGQSGNANVGAYITQSTIGGTTYDFNGAVANGFVPNKLAVQNLTWEKTNEYDGALEMNLFDNRIAFQMGLYRKTSKGLIYSRAIPSLNGFGNVTTNLGSLRNSGVELDLTTQNVKASKLTWTISFNFTKNNNKILNVYGEGDPAEDRGNQKFIGKKARIVFGPKVIGVWQTSEATAAAVYGQKPGQWKIEDINHDNKIDDNDRQDLGSDIPVWFGGMTNTVNFANLDFGITLYTRQGVFQQSQFLNQFLNGDQGRARFNSYDRDYWTPTNPSNEWANSGLEQDGFRRSAAEYRDASYTKISNMTLGYTIPKKLIGKSVNRLRVYLDAYNPFIFTKFQGWDPETADLSSGGPQDFRTRTFMFGLNLTL